MLHVSKLQKIVKQLQDLGEVISDNMLITKILMTLPENYNYFFTSINDGRRKNTEKPNHQIKHGGIKRCAQRPETWPGTRFLSAERQGWELPVIYYDDFVQNGDDLDDYSDEIACFGVGNSTENNINRIFVPKNPSKNSLLKF
uniref:Uncharacterized protein n=1 Tax=Megaselia scalaris TaxID=36166 RepID=T1GG31_MEGSC